MKKMNKKSRGQSIVEWAIILPFLILVVVSIVELAPLMNTFLKIEKAAQYGGRTGAIHGNTNQEILDAVVFNLQGMTKKEGFDSGTEMSAANGNPEIYAYSETHDGYERTYVEISPGRIENRINGGWVMVKVKYEYNIYTPLLRVVLNGNQGDRLIDNKRFPIVRYAIYRVE